MEKLSNDIEVLKAIIKELLEKNPRLEAENAEWRRRFGMDRTNRHKPPSSDGYAKKSLKPGLPKEKHTKGGQTGHQGKTLERVAQADRLEIQLPGQCQCCGRPITAADNYEVIGSRQVFDLPSPKLDVLEPRLGQIECCGVKQHGEYPVNVTASVQSGEKVKALIVKLSIDHQMPLAQIRQLFEDTYGYKLNSTTIEETLKPCYELAEPIEPQVKERLLEADTVPFEETGIRAGGKWHWLQTASTENYTHLFIHDQRGQEALNSDASILTDYRGRAVHDCWAPYFKFEGANHALGGAHLLRELEGLKENGSLWAGPRREFLLEMTKTPPAANTQAQVRDQYQRILSPADLEEPKPQPSTPGKAKPTAGRNLHDRFQKYADEVHAFAFEVGVPDTFNQAERDLRGSKVKPKESGGFRTRTGAEVYARLPAATSTFRQQGLKVFATRRDWFLRRSVELA
jgi:transposase